MKRLITKKTILSLLVLMTACSGFIRAAVGDAGVQSILSPTDPVCTGTAPVTVIISNYDAGISISTLTVNWRVNGVLQTAFNYSGSLSPLSQDTVSLGNFMFSGGSYAIEAWTSDPNGSVDSDSSNDSASATINVSTALTGTYTIRGASPDFANFNAAIAALAANGVCGPVVFNIRPGTDTLQSVIPQISGADSINTITFQSENGDSSSVTLTFPSQDTLNFNYLIKLDGADYLTFHKITMERSGIKANGRIIEFSNTATNITISNCRLIGVTGLTTNSLTALVYSTSGATTNDSMVTFINNRLLNGSLGIYMNGISSLSLENYLIIRNNLFINQYSKGVQMSNVGYAKIEDNTFVSSSNYSGYAAIYLDRSNRPHSIRRNKISGVPGTGIYLVDCTAQSGVHGVIANNFIHTNDSAGISMVNGDFQDVVFNSISMTGTTQTFAPLLMRGSGTGKIVMNNVLSNTGGGYAYVVSDSAVFGIAVSNYNDLFTTGSFIGQYNGVQQADLAAWISASGRDSNSISVNPNFASVSDLHCTSIAMDDRGKPFGGITTDIDGETRSALTPDIGADEYSSVSRNVGITALVFPENNNCGSATTNVKVQVSNTGGFTESNFNVVTEITGSLDTTLTQNHSASLPAGTSDTLTYSATLDLSAGGTFNFKIYTSLSVDDVRANDTLTVTINLSAPPSPPAASGVSICGPGSGTLNATSTDTVKWYSASTGGTLLATGSSFITPVVNTTTTYYAASKSACESSRTPVTLTVLPLPSVNLGNDTSINQGQQITLNAGAASSYLWSTTQVTQTINVNTTGCYWVRITNASGCQARDTICVTVIQPFDVGVTAITSPSNNDCADDSIQILLNVSNLGANSATGIPVTVDITGAVTANFHDTIQSTINASSNVIVNMGMINASSGGVIVITAYTSYSNDLDNSNDTLINSDTIIVQPVIPSGIGGSRCGPGTVVLVSSSAQTVYWYDAPTGGNLVFTGNNYVLNNLTSTTTYYAQSGQVCNNQDRRAVTGTINPLPTLNFPTDTTVTDSIVLNPGAGFTNYQWSTNATTQTITVKNNGTYSVCVTDPNGCSNCDTINVTIVVGIDQIAGSDNVKLYPNPANTSVTLELSEVLNGEADIIIVNMHGQVILRDELKNSLSMTFDVSRFARGIYQVMVRTEEGSSAFKLIVE